MGIALGLGVVLGVRAVNSSLAGVLPVIILFGATAVVTRASARHLSLFAVLGCLIGAAAGIRSSDQTSRPLPSAPTGTIEGRIVSDPGITPSGSVAQFAWQDSESISRQSTLSVPAAPLIGRGDRIEVYGTVDGQAGERIFAEHVRILAGPGWLERQRRSIRQYLSDVIQSRVPGSPGALTLGLVIGDDSALTKAERNDLRRAGLSHMTAVSGWNVTLVTGAVGLICLRRGLRGWTWTTLQLLALVGFVWVVGLEPPVTRAAVMAVAGLVSIRLGRPAHSVTTLTLAVAVMVAVSPTALSSLSFQLSVLATLGLVLAARLTEHLDGWQSVALTPLIATAMAGLLTAPLLAAVFGTLSLMTVPANVFAMPFVPAATVMGIVAVATNPIEPAGTIAGFASWLLSSILLRIAQLFAAMPYGFHEFAPLSDVSQAAIYAVILIATIAFLPEGRLIARMTSEWAHREPVGAVLSAGAACFALLAATFSV